MVLIYWSRSSLRASSCLGRSGGGAGKGRRPCNYVSGVWIPISIPKWLTSSELSDFRQSVRSGNKREGKNKQKIRAKGIDVITNVISANQHLASTFSMHIFKFQRRTCSCKLSYFSRPAARAPRRAYSQANPGLQMRVQFLHHSIRVVCRHGRAAIFKNTCIMRIASKPVGLEKKGNLIKN